MGEPLRTGVLRRARLHVSGTVQGVGFRPHVHRLATALDLDGFVYNDTAGVVIEVEGEPATVARFVDRLAREAPPLARIDRCESTALPPRGLPGFSILASRDTPTRTAAVTPDSATCPECLRELFDPRDRRFRFPFINCTNCGPRFTIVREVPYDRPGTTMAMFDMCPACQVEYRDPSNRRFHAQPNACPDCGPTLRWDSPGTTEIVIGDAALASAVAELGAGRIIAVKGLGGYHLACLARDEEAVRRLRRRKHREERPFALMVADLAAARGVVALDDLATDLLTSHERPIVLARRRPAAHVADAVAPGHHHLGVMLPYTPLHHLLLADVGEPLVMTSGNRSGEPIAWRNDEARERLADIADGFLVHDRPIHVRCDDSVVRAVTVAGTRHPLMLRRSRGYVPGEFRLPIAAATPLVACGAHLKNTFALARDDHVWVGHHIGDLENFETLQSFEQGIGHFEQLFAVEPARIAHDLHPDYLSTRHAEQRAEVTGALLDPVQHHHAHMAAVLAEHGERGPAIGVIYDGTGFGSDGGVWGGELLHGDLADFERIGHLWPVAMPGGEAAIHQPWRMACAWLVALDAGQPAIPASIADRVEGWRWRAVCRLARSGLASPRTTSMGRLFDAVSALIGIRTEVTYEGQAAIELEQAVHEAADDTAYPLPLVTDQGSSLLLLDARQTIRAIVADLAAGVIPAHIAARFHAGVASGTVAACVRSAERLRTTTVVLSGGVFQNIRLLEQVAHDLAGVGLRPLVPSRMPPNDGGISLGQAAVAAARSAAPPS